MRPFPVAFFLSGFIALSAFAQEPEEPAPAPEPSLDCSEAITVFQDVSGIGRKDRAARNMSKRHREMAESGWQFADMEVYTENGDLEGFYITYTRDTACPQITSDDD